MRKDTFKKTDVKHFAIFLLAICLSFCWACQGDGAGTKNPSTDPTGVDASALPHGESLPATELSEADRQKLAQAKGRDVPSIAANELADLLQQSPDGLHVVNFWRFDCPQCMNTNRILADLVADKGANAPQVFLVNTDLPSKLAEVRTYIREENFSQKVFQLRPEVNAPDFSGLLPQWSGDLPATWLFNKADGINLLYHRAYGAEEMQAIIEPFLLR